MKKLLSLLMLLLMTLPAINATNYTLVTDLKELEDGARYVIAAIDANYAISKTQNSNNRAAEAKTKSRVAISLADTDNVAVFTLKGSTDAWTFYDEEKNGYLYAAATSAKNNYLKTSGDVGTYGSKNTCKITLDDDYTAHIVFNIDASYPNTLVLNNSNSPKIFSCYKADRKSVV